MVRLCSDLIEQPRSKTRASILSSADKNSTSTGLRWKKEPEKRIVAVESSSAVLDQFTTAG